MEILADYTQELLNLKKYLKEIKKVVITTHINPDGDAIGSSMGLALALESLGYDVTAIIPNGMPAFISWMDAEGQLLNFEENPALAQERINEAEIIFCLDYNTLKRVDKLGDLISNANKKLVLVDHHQQPDDFDFMFSLPSVSSTCEIVYELLTCLEWDHHITEHAAKCLYTGIMTDTGSFRYRGTSGNTLMVGSKLIGKGVNPAEINELVNNASSLNRLKLLGFSINEKLEIVKDKGVAYIFLSESDLKQFDYQPGDTEGLVNMALGVDEIKVSVLIKQQDNKIKFSFRSKGEISVNDFARKYFDGGGHINAAGGVSFESWETTKIKFLNAVNEFF